MTNTSESAAVTAGQFATFSLAANSGYKVSFTNLSRLDYRRSGTGPTNGELQYQVGTSSSWTSWLFVQFNLHQRGVSGDNQSLWHFRAPEHWCRPDVTFRIVNWGASSSVAHRYIFDVASSTATISRCKARFRRSLFVAHGFGADSFAGFDRMRGHRRNAYRQRDRRLDPYACQWKTNGAAISGATGSTYSHRFALGRRCA